MKGFICLIACAITLGNAADLRVACNALLAGWMRDSSADAKLEAIIRSKRQALDYYHSLGYTHVLYPMEIPYAPVFRKTAQGWTYNQGVYDAGDHAQSLAVMKKEAESRGMTLVPALQSLSHVDAFIKLDSTISEFDRANPKPPPPWLWEAGLKAAYQGSDGVASAGPLGANPGADQFFREYLRIIKAVWVKQGGPGAHPAQVLIGHDELGYASVCFIKAGKSKRRTETAAELAAMEIDARHAQMREIIDSTVGVWMFADSFVPGDYGETYGLAGDPETGAGGTLRLLKDKYGMDGSLTVVPWIYSSLESDGVDGRRKLIISKARQLAYLDRLGIPFIVGTGEDGIQPYAAFVDRTMQCVFEWVREGRKHAMLRGYANLSFNNFDACAGPKGSKIPVCSGYSAPLLAYLAWTGRAPLSPTYSSGTFSGVDYLRSRWELSWKAGVDYPAGN